MASRPTADRSDGRSKRAGGSTGRLHVQRGKKKRLDSAQKGKRDFAASKKKRGLWTSGAEEGEATLKVRNK